MTSQSTRKKLTSKLAYAAVGWVSALSAAIIMGSLFALITAAAATVVSAAFFIKRTRHSRFMLLISAAALAGAVSFSVYNARIVKRQQALAGKEITIVGTIHECRRTASDTLRLTVKGSCEGAGRSKVIVYCRDIGISCGDRVRVTFTAELPQNSAVFDGEDYYSSQGIFLQSRGSAEVEAVGGINYPLRAVNRLRDRMSAAIAARCPGQAGAFIISALCGDKSRLDSETVSVINRSGLAHIFAVSGTHVVILCSFISLLIEAFISSKRLRSAVMLLILAGFAVFSGCSVSVIRACLMSGIGFTAAFFDRRGSSANSLGLAAILITLSCPYALTSASFLLSFTAAFSIGVLSPKLCRGRVSSRTAQLLVSYICIFIMSFPIAAYLFSEISLVWLLTNLLLLPLCSVCLTSAFLFMLTGGLFAPAIYLAELSAAAVIKVCAAVTRSPLSYTGTYHKKALIILGIIAVIVTLAAAVKRRRSGADILLCAVCFSVVCASAMILTALKPRDMLVVYPNGGDYAALLCTDDQAMIFDIGDRGRFRYNIARETEQLHARDIRLFLTSSSYSTMLRYRGELSGIGGVYAADGIGSIEAMPDELEISGVIVSYDGGYDVSIGGHSIRLESGRIVIDGREYSAEGFEDISVFKL